LYIYPELFSAGATWSLLSTLQAVDRPNEHGSWEHFSSSRRIAWKTGTSYGFRDAWAVGVNPDVTIGVWVGNADGEGRPGIIGSKAAAPILFELLSFFERSGDFPIPYDDLEYGIVCTTSGRFASSACPAVDTIFIPRAGDRTDPCPYHREFFVDRETGLRADRSCAQVGVLEKRSWFVLPPGPAWYYAKTHPGYLPLPPWKEGCRGNTEDQPLTIVYPGAHARIELPVELNGQTEPAVMQAAHRNPSETIHWHLDGRYLASTQQFHTVALNTMPGRHQLVIVDGKGNREERVFEVVE
jgi:penicillin-binding protein 1C